MITRSQYLVFLEPKLSNIWHEAFPARPVEYTAFCNVRTTRKRTVTDAKTGETVEIVTIDRTVCPSKALTVKGESTYILHPMNIKV